MNLESVPLVVDQPVESDELLLQYIKAKDDIEARQRLSELIVENDRIIRGVITAKLGLHPGQSGHGRAAEDYDDIYADALLRVIARLHSLRNGSEQLPIRRLAPVPAPGGRQRRCEGLPPQRPHRHPAENA